MRKRRNIALPCRSKPRAKPSQSKFVRKPKVHRTHRVNDNALASIPDNDLSSSDEEYHLHRLGVCSSTPIYMQMQVNKKELEMEVDSGAAVSIISDGVRKSLFPDLRLRNSSVVLKTYTGEPMEVVGNLHVDVCYKQQQAKLVLVVVGGNGPSLLGRNWLKYIRLDWNSIATVRSVTQRSEPLQNLMKKNLPLFEDRLGTAVEPYKVKLLVKADATPIFKPPCSVPFAIKAAVGHELDRLEEQGIIEKVTHSDWAAPLVVVPKKDGTFRLCGDYKVTVNRVLAVDQYPLPKPQDLYATLAGGTVFSKLDFPKLIYRCS